MANEVVQDSLDKNTSFLDSNHFNVDIGQDDYIRALRRFRTCRKITFDKCHVLSAYSMVKNNSGKSSFIMMEETHISGEFQIKRNFSFYGSLSSTFVSLSVLLRISVPMLTDKSRHTAQMRSATHSENDLLIGHSTTALQLSLRI